MILANWKVLALKRSYSTYGVTRDARSRYVMLVVGVGTAQSAPSTRNAPRQMVRYSRQRKEAEAKRQRNEAQSASKALAILRLVFMCSGSKWLWCRKVTVVQVSVGVSGRIKEVLWELGLLGD